MKSQRNTQNRKTEALLLLAVQIVLVLGLALVFFGKKVSTEYAPSAAVNINAATAGQLARALSVSPAVAAKLVTARGHGWTSLYSLRHAKVLKGVQALPITDAAFVVRTPAEAARLFWGGACAFLLAFWAAHFVLRKSAPNADPFLLPWVALLSGVGLMLVYSVKDPYRDATAFSGQVWGVALYGMLALLLPLTRPFGRLPLRRYQYVYAGAAAAADAGAAGCWGTGRAAFTLSCWASSLWSSSNCCWCCLWRLIWPSGGGCWVTRKQFCRV